MVVDVVSRLLRCIVLKTAPGAGVLPDFMVFGLGGNAAALGCIQCRNET
jgi:hypothetical protein